MREQMEQPGEIDGEEPTRPGACSKYDAMGCDRDEDDLPIDPSACYVCRAPKSAHGPRRPQHQGSLNDQLRMLQVLANQAGLYDAADWVRARLDEQDARRQR